MKQHLPRLPFSRHERARKVIQHQTHNTNLETGRQTGKQIALQKRPVEASGSLKGEPDMLSHKKKEGR